MPEPIEFELTAKDAQLDLTLRKDGKLADELGEKLEKAAQRSKRGAEEAASGLKRQRKELEDLTRDLKTELALDDQITRERQANARKNEETYRREVQAHQDAINKRRAAENAAASQRIQNRYAQEQLAWSTPRQRMQQQFGWSGEQWDAHVAARIMAVEGAKEEGAKAHEKAQQKAAREAKKTATAVKEISQANQESFGDAALGKIAGYVAGLATITGAINVIRTAFEKQAEARRQAMESGQGQAAIRGKLATMARSPKEAEALFARADAGAVLGGVSRDRSAQVLYNLMNAGRESEFESVMRVAPLMPPEELSEATARLPKLLKSKKTGMALSNMVFEAGREAYADPSELLREMPAAAAGQKFIGGDEAEVITLLGQMTDLTKSPRIAADRLRHFGLHMGAKKEFSGKGFIGTMQALQAMPAEQRDQLINADELRDAYEMMQQVMPDYGRRRAAVVQAGKLSGTKNAPIEVARTALLGVPSEKAKYEASQAEQAEIEARENNLGLSSTKTETIFRKQREADEKAKVDVAQRFGRGQGQSVAWSLGFEGDKAAAISEFGKSAGRGNVFNSILQLINALNSNTAATNGNTRTAGQSASPVPSRAPTPSPPKR